MIAVIFEVDLKPEEEGGVFDLTVNRFSNCQSKLSSV